jgi:transposase-like protein
MECKKCKSEKIKKNGKRHGKQRYMCKECGKTFNATAPQYTREDKERALMMYMNNCGVRKTALFIGCSPTSVVNWVRESKRKIDKSLESSDPNYSETPDVIELDEIYTFVQKNETER